MRDHRAIKAYGLNMGDNFMMMLCGLIGLLTLGIINADPLYIKYLAWMIEVKLRNGILLD